jgi:outer membrane protein OmpA-like peptidoglycan-associated protein
VRRVPRYTTALCTAAVLGLAAGALPAAADPADDPCRRMFDWIDASEIRFQVSTATLLGTSSPVLERLAEYAHDCPAMRLRITGHTDAEGSAEYNLRLSERRAAAVADFLVGRGIDPGRLVIVGEGANRPIGDNGTAAGRERNRRIELELLPPA